MKRINAISMVSLLIVSVSLAACGGGGGGRKNNSIVSKSSVNSSVQSLLQGSSTDSSLSNVNSSINENSQSSIGQGSQPSIDQGLQSSIGQGLQSSIGRGSQSSIGQGSQSSISQSLQSSISSSSASFISSQSSITSSISSLFSLDIVSPSSDIYIPVNSELEIIANFSGISADQLQWQVSPNTDASITPVSTSNNATVVKFKATKNGSYNIQVTNTSNIQYAQIDVDVHPVYLAIDTEVQNQILLRSDGQIISYIGNVPTETGMTKIAAGFGYGLAIDAAGKVHQWGLAPAPVPSGLSNVKSIAAAYHGAAAIQNDGKLVIWGKLNDQFFSVPNSLSEKAFIEAEPIGTTGDFAVLDTDNKLTVFNGGDGSELTLPNSWQEKKFAHICALNNHLLVADTEGLLYIWKVIESRESLPALETLPEITAPVDKVFCNGDEQAAIILSDGKVISWGADQNITYFDSSTIPGFPKIKAVGLYTYANPTFLTEEGAYIDRNNKLITTYDE